MPTVLFAAVVLFSLMVCAWLISVVQRDASLVDRLWGLLFVLLAVIYLGPPDGANWRQLLTIFLVAIWGLRLAVHIHTRNRGHGEDIRYQRMRQAHGRKFWWYSLFSVFLLQGALALVISAPLYFIFVQPQSPALRWTDIVGFAVWVVGFVFEIGGDWQLRRFKANPSNKGKLLTTGFWSLTRHPNYFGDACLWWGFYVIALAAEWGWAAFFGPVLMTYFLRYVSGVTLLEKDLKQSKVGYAEYIASTPAFFPRLWLR